MFDGRPADAGKAEQGYVETDPTGRYGRFKEVLGKGATKTVYKAFDELQGMEVAWNQVKLNDVLHSPEELQRLYSEVHLLSTLSHDSIIRYYSSWIDVENRTFNFITEMFTSGSLREYRRRYKRVNIRAVKNWARQILKGLVYLHQHDPPVIHRDIKCDNIFVNGHLGQVKIGDLGLAAILKGSQAAHSVIGTPEFMAPELYEEEYNELVDVYSFGMCVLEMLTSEYPYSECCNPAQIYKKVTSGKLPEAYYRIHDPEAQRFIGKCLENASKRLSAKELLLDPFIQYSDDGSTTDPQPLDNKGEGSRSASENPDEATKSDMTITGKMNPDDNTIFLTVQIADKDGKVKNVYFPFDIFSDTSIDVATEMVKELEITDREPHEIADVIDKEISALVPHWRLEMPQSRQHYSFNFKDEDSGAHQLFYPPPSPSSSYASVFAAYNYSDDKWARSGYCSQDDLSADDETSSQISQCYSNYNYFSCNENETELSAAREDSPSKKSHESTRFCPDEQTKAAPSMLPQCYDRCNRRKPSHGRKSVADRCLSRIRSFVDIRTQLLHRSLMEDMNKRRLFKTVGAVENIGFQTPCDIPHTTSNRVSSSKQGGDGKKQGLKWKKG